ncbi:MAG: 4-hydroxythreonine-4-phosphate dehydrogenase PdxA [Muribaculaceae bacterium]|nr:4-hydroxythreonine-4-phosphate dehydrogenase PdxA [Muribaculaceae bacterium]
MNNKIRVAITHGDFNGIGYEVIIKALAIDELSSICTPVIFGSAELLAQTAKSIGAEYFYFNVINSAADVISGTVNVVDCCGPDLVMTPGHPSEQAGIAAAQALEAACQALEDGEVDVLVTAPINKRTIYHPERFPYPGHTEFLETRIGHGQKATMILFDDNIRVALVTTHLPLRAVPDAITKESVVDKIRDLNDALGRDFARDHSRIAVFSLNPHNGDNGLLGSEEIEEIEPAIAECVKEGILAFGPYAADGFFGNGTFKHFDGIIAMYHDQGLAPFKALAGEYGVNYTAGLPFVRTSPDHGTGYDIAGKNIADPTSMRQAIYKAIDIFRNRKNYDRFSKNPL